ncbi:DNA gyrase subunit B [Buttiauxella izardii]|uniref:DNA gyrase subunit B n=1 Tax=Buttiauxella izardii TaxID=82991 RepID=A0A3A5JLQ4_9ENTR|nr:DNA gyrase subunit B [Buttiauxella izardii]
MSIAGGLAVIGWPFAVWLVIAYPHLHILLPILALCFVLRLCTLRGKTGALSRAFKGLAIAGAVLCVASIWMREAQLLLWYPVVVNGVMLALFGSSLFSRMSIVERLARWREGDLPPAGVRYTRRVTQVWCVFFIVNGSIALWTSLAGNIHWWTLWNGMMSYVLMGLLFAGEWLVRQRVKRRYE